MHLWQTPLEIQGKSPGLIIALVLQNVPQQQIHYGAEDKDETCRMSLNDPNCDSDYWWVKVDMSDDDEDSDSGLKEVDFIAEGQNMYGNDIIYR